MQVLINLNYTLGINNRQNGGMFRGGGRELGGQHSRSFSTSDLMGSRREGDDRGERGRGHPADMMMGERNQDMMGGRGQSDQGMMGGRGDPAERMMEEMGRGFSDRGINNGMDIRGHGQHFQVNFYLKLNICDILQE